MRLSDAIALGRTLIKAQPGTLWDLQDDSGCALGMALEAVGRRLKYAVPSSALGGEPQILLKIPDEFQWALALAVNYPCGCTASFKWSAFNVITHLFDHHVYDKEDWTLEELIDWVRSVEPEEQKIVKEEKSAVEQRLEKVGV